MELKRYTYLKRGETLVLKSKRFDGEPAKGLLPTSFLCLAPASVSNRVVTFSGSFSVSLRMSSDGRDRGCQCRKGVSDRTGGTQLIRTVERPTTQQGVRPDCSARAGPVTWGWPRRVCSSCCSFSCILLWRPLLAPVPLVT